MSTEGKVKSKKLKRISEKDKRMVHLEKEIERLEQENKVLKRESIEYHNRLEAALLKGAGALPVKNITNLSPFKSREKTASSSLSASKTKKNSVIRDPVESAKKKIRTKGNKTKKNSPSK